MSPCAQKVQCPVNTSFSLVVYLSTKILEVKMSSSRVGHPVGDQWVLGSIPTPRWKFGGREEKSLGIYMSPCAQNVQCPVNTSFSLVVHHLTQRVHWFSETAQSSMTASVQCVGINQRYIVLYLLIKGVYCDFKEGKVMHMEVPTALPPNTNHLWGPKQIPPRDVPIGHHSDLPRHNPCHNPSQLWPL